MEGQITLSGHSYPAPPVVCIVKELRQCPVCNAKKEQGFDFRYDKTLLLGAACRCQNCGFSF